MQARSHGIAGDRDGGNAQCNAQNTQKKRLHSMSVKLFIKPVKQPVKASVKTCPTRKLEDNC